MANVLCVWEHGSDLGHISRLSAITRSLEQQGHKVTLALKDVTRCTPFFENLQARVIQAPSWHVNLKMQRPIACLADTLLLSGYLDVDVLTMLVRAWISTVSLINPDVVIFDYAPTALLAMKDQSTAKKIVIGYGFSVPEPGFTITDWRYPVVNDGLIQKQEEVVLHPINRTLERFHKTPLSLLSDLWGADRIILNEYPCFDPYQNQRANADYALKDDAIADCGKVVFPASNNKKLLAYLKPSYANLELVLKILSLSMADVFVVCPMGDEKVFKKYKSKTFNYSIKLVNLVDALKRSDVFVGHGNASSVKEAINENVPIVVFPNQQEQVLIGKVLEEQGAGFLVTKIESPSDTANKIDEIISDTSYCYSIKKLKEGSYGINRSMADLVVEAVN